MADVCALARGGALSPLSPNESRKRVRGSSAGDCASTFFKRHRTGQSFARRLLHLRRLAVDTRQAEELVRFIDQFPPEMDKDVSKILEKCGDIDDAIRQLTALRVGATQSGDGSGDGDARKEKIEKETAEGVSAGASATGTASVPPVTDQATAALASAEAAARLASAASANGRTSVSAAQAPTTLTREWIEALVSEMTGASDVADAHVRAERVLTAFEATVTQNTIARGGAGGGTGLAGETLVKENLILKRAVAIQNQRLEEQEGVKHQVAELQRVVLSYQERLQNVERQNYSLGVHLKQAMGVESPGMFNRNPDVF